MFPFELDDFQKNAIAALDRGKSVVVCAPTGSGKTLIGEYSIYRALHRNKRVFYTTPLKALSNQKFRDFQEKLDSPQLVGLITGDEVENPQAPVVVMTTEIFRNMLYETPIGQVGTSLEDVEAVVLDECHYISDPGRGTVWEESIIYCPPRIQLVALSATIGNPEELTDWINQVRHAAENKEGESIKYCELINSDFRPVPLQFHFSTVKGLFPLLDSKGEKRNPQLKDLRQGGPSKRIKQEDCPTMVQILNQLQEKEMLPGIYLIFSRRGCDRAVEELQFNFTSSQERDKIKTKLLEFFLLDNPDLQGKILQLFPQNFEYKDKLLGFLANNPGAKKQFLRYLAHNREDRVQLWEFLATHAEGARAGQIEPLMRGIAAHHAGILPAWKKLVEKLFEMGLVKLVFATATLAAGINMPARTTIISALSKRSEDGHRLLTSSEFVQIAGRAGRRGMDVVGHVVTIQTRFEGSKEAAKLATASAEPLTSWFAPSYGMVLNLLQKHSIEEAKDLLERSFAEYLAEQRLAPQQQAIAELTTKITKIDVELAPVQVSYFASYEKLWERVKEEIRLLEILQQQAEAARKREIAPYLAELKSGNIVYLKGKHVRVALPLAAVLFTKVEGSGQAPYLLCLGSDNRWYVANKVDVADINQGIMPPGDMAELSFPSADNLRLGRSRKGDERTAPISKKILDCVVPTKPAPEVMVQQAKVEQLQDDLKNHPLRQFADVNHIIKRQKQRLELRDQLYSSQAKYKKQKSSKSYYWEEFLNLIKVLRQFGALDEYSPTTLGQAAAAVRTENELWLALALMSGELEGLESFHLAAVVSALIMEPPRPDSWTEYQRSKEVLEVLERLSSLRKELLKTQRTCDVGFPVCFELDFLGLVETWALGKEFGVEWGELCHNTSLDEGDVVRMLRRTVDVLLQIPQIPGVSHNLIETAKEAISNMKRFPI